MQLGAAGELPADQAVQLPPFQALLQFLRPAFDDGKVDAELRRGSLDGLQPNEAGKCRRCPQADLPGLPIPVRKAALELVDHGEDMLGLGKQALALGSGDDAARMTGKQRRADQVFQRPYL